MDGNDSETDEGREAKTKAKAAEFDLQKATVAGAVAHA